MTIDSVVQKTGITLAVVVIVAAATWFLTARRRPRAEGRASLYMLTMVGSLGGFALAMVNSFKRVVSPAPRARLRRARGCLRRRVQQDHRGHVRRRRRSRASSSAR